jgi:hypothetical protein
MLRWMPLPFIVEVPPQYLNKLVEVISHGEFTFSRDAVA